MHLKLDFKNHLTGPDQKSLSTRVKRPAMLYALCKAPRNRVYWVRTLDEEESQSRS